MDLNSEKQRPQKVEVVNNSANPTEVKVQNLPITANGYVETFIRGGNIETLNRLRPASASYVNVFLENILLLQSDGTLVPLPLCSFLSNLSNVQLQDALASYKTAYSTLVSGITAATLHYSKMTSAGVVTSEVYNLKD